MTDQDDVKKYLNSGRSRKYADFYSMFLDRLNMGLAFQAFLTSNDVWCMMHEVCPARRAMDYIRFCLMKEKELAANSGVHGKVLQLVERDIDTITGRLRNNIMACYNPPCADCGIKADCIERWEGISEWTRGQMMEFPPGNRVLHSKGSGKVNHSIGIPMGVTYVIAAVSPKHLRLVLEKYAEAPDTDHDTDVYVTLDPKTGNFVES